MKTLLPPILALALVMTATEASAATIAKSRCEPAPATGPCDPAAKPGPRTGINAFPADPARPRVGSAVGEKGKRCADANGHRVSCREIDAVPATPRPKPPSR